MTGTTAAVVYTIEPWSSMWPEVESLMEEHRREVSPLGHVPMIPDVDTLHALDQAGAGVFTVARHDSVMIGYCMFFLSPDLEFAGTQAANQGPWYCVPRWRGRVGAQLLLRALSELRRLGIHRKFLHRWERSPDGRRLDKLFERLGAHPLERVYELWEE